MTTNSNFSEQLILIIESIVTSIEFQVKNNISDVNSSMDSSPNKSQMSIEEDLSYKNESLNNVKLFTDRIEK